MLQANELVLFVLGFLSFTFLIVSWSRLKKIPYITVLAAAIALQLGAWFFTNIEAFFWTDGFNFLEHGCDFISSLLVLVWCYYIFTGKERQS